MIWTDAYLTKLAEDAAGAVVLEVDLLFHRFYLAVTDGLSTYTLDEKVNKILKISWKGKILQPLMWEDACLMFPGKFFVDGSTNDETIGEPRYYIQHPTNRRDIRLFPAPNETLSAAGGDPYSPVVGESRCTITCWRFSDTDVAEASLPDWIDQRIRKSYVLWRAFQKEGPGQDLKAASYYSTKFKFMLEVLKQVNSHIFVTKRHILEPTRSMQGSKPARPQLPSNFERVNYK